MNSNLESQSHSGVESRADVPPENSESLHAAEAPEENHLSEVEVKFAGELGWLAAASVTIASVAAGVGMT